MKSYFKLLGAALVTISASTLLLGQEGQKKPAMVTQAQAQETVDKTYAIVQTTIYKAADAEPIVTRAMVDTISRNRRQGTKALDVKLETPVPPVTINTYGVTKVVDSIGQTVGSIGAAKIGGQEVAANPKLAIIGKSVQLAAAFTDVAVKIAESELSKLYENQQTRVTLLEILPMNYYAIDDSTGMVNLTDQAVVAYENYQTLLKDYLETFAKYRQYENAFATMSDQAKILDPTGTGVKDPKTGITQFPWEMIKKFDEEQVQPLLKLKNKLEDELARTFPPYRIAIMASPADPGNTCGAAGKGPWELYVIYYIGAKQTNRIAVKYCVKNPKDFQRLIVKVIGNSIQQINPKRDIQQFLPGGVQLEGASNANTTFAQTTGLGQVDFNAPRTEVFNWFQSMITNPAAGGIGQFLVPFDIFTMRQTLAQRAAANPADAELQALSQRMDQFAGAITAAQQQAATLEEQKKKEEEQKKKEEEQKKKEEEQAKIQAQIKEKTEALDKLSKDLKQMEREREDIERGLKEGMDEKKKQKIEKQIVDLSRNIEDLKGEIKKLQSEIEALTGATAATTTTAGVLRSTTPTTRTQATQTTPTTTPSQPRTTAGKAVDVAKVGVDALSDILDTLGISQSKPSS